MHVTSMRLAALILFAGFFTSFYWYFPTISADLMATILAGKFLAMGRPDQVYPALTDIFLMYPPSEWRGFMALEYGYEGPVFPFIYPPLWAKLAALLAGLNLWRVAAVALVINTALLFLTIVLAMHATRTRLNPAIYAALATFFLMSNLIGTIALLQNQPQILVSFLLVLAIERARNGGPIAAGAALALAAAIKIYPAFFALFWLFGRERRAFGAFVVFGGALGLISLIWAGWPLHQAFLDQLRLISGSVLVTGITYNLDAAVAQLFFASDLVRIVGLEAPTPVNPDPGWFSMLRPGLWRITSPAILLIAVALLTRGFASVDRATQAAALWPLALIVVAILSPISWSYYFIPAACFAPVLLERLGLRRGAFFLVLAFGLIFRPNMRLYRVLSDLDGWPTYVSQLAGVLAMVILAAGFWQATRGGAKAG
ncbi:MAG: glycosyltransferase family 87 protein [Paracoccaceae bacterium]